MPDHATPWRGITRRGAAQQHVYLHNMARRGMAGHATPRRGKLSHATSRHAKARHIKPWRGMNANQPPHSSNRPTNQPINMTERLSG
eukprot:596025-Lingulodinium_polyedra.AAC.1